MSLPLDQFLKARSAFGATIDASGRQLYFLSNANGVPNLFCLRLDQAEAQPEPLFTGAERVQYAFPAPRPGRLVFGLDHGGDERTQLFLIDGSGYPPRALTRRPECLHTFGDWHADGRSILYTGNDRDARYFDIYLLDVEGGEPRRVLQHDSFNRALGFEPGGHRLLIQRVHTPSEHELLLVDTVDGITASLTTNQPASRYVGARWSAEDGKIYCLTDCESDFLLPCRIDVASGNRLTLETQGFDFDDVFPSPDGRRLVYSANREGYSELYLRELATGKTVSLDSPAGGICFEAGRWAPTFGWSHDGNWLALTFTTATSAPDIWLTHLPSGETRRATMSWNADLSSDVLIEPERVSYRSFDGLEIPAFVYRPKNGVPARSRPALFFVHGGPESQHRPSFNPVVQYFAHRGFVVVAPNVRGSTGYGKLYSHLDDVERRPDAVADLAAGAEWLAASGEANPSKIAVMGASYGGYMVLAALTERPDLWAAGVDIVGIANFVTFLQRTGPWRRAQREAEYGSLERHRDLLERLSPLNRADRIAAPLMVIHGANDPRVPISEADQIVASLQARSRTVDYLFFEDEGHGLVKLDNRLTAYQRIAEFLEKHLL